MMNILENEAYFNFHESPSCSVSFRNTRRLPESHQCLTGSHALSKSIVKTMTEC